MRLVYSEDICSYSEDNPDRYIKAKALPLPPFSPNFFSFSFVPLSLLSLRCSLSSLSAVPDPSSAVPFLRSQVSPLSPFPVFVFVFLFKNSFWLMNILGSMILVFYGLWNMNLSMVYDYVVLCIDCGLWNLGFVCIFWICVLM